MNTASQQADLILSFRADDDFMGALQLLNVDILAAIFWSGKTDSNGKCVCDYKVYHNGTLLFESNGSNQIHLSPFHAPDSPDATFSLLAFIGVQEGDTDEGYFAGYTVDQLMFSRSYDCELLKCEVSDFEEGNRDHYKYYSIADL